MMRSAARRTILAVAMFVAACAPAVAQNNSLDIRPADINSDGAVTYQFGSYNRLFADGKVLFEALYLRIPGLDVFDDYDEVSVGVGLRLMQKGGFRMFGIAHYAVATDSAQFIQPALITDFSRGRWTASSFVQRYIAITDNAASAWLVDPAEIQFTIAGPLALGVSAYLFRADGGSALTKIGPKVSVADKYGATELRVAHVNQGASVEYQVRRIILF